MWSHKSYHSALGRRPSATSTTMGRAFLRRPHCCGSTMVNCQTPGSVNRTIHGTTNGTNNNDTSSGNILRNFQYIEHKCIPKPSWWEGWTGIGTTRYFHDVWHYFDIMLVNEKKIKIRDLLKGHGECAASSIKSNLSVLVIRYAKICILKCVWYKT